MTSRQPPAEERDLRRSALRTARAGRGWSQSRAAAELHALAARRGGPEASPASLKTQLSRWENGHALPEPDYRELLAALYERPAEQLGLLPRGAAPRADAAASLRAELAAAAAAGPPVLQQWSVQLDAARRLDDELGAAGSAEVTAALVAQLSRTLAHTLGGERRSAVARLLAGAATLAGRHALDRAEPAEAWARFAVARAAAAEAGSGAALAAVAEGQAAVLRAAGVPESAEELLAAVVADGAGGHAGARLAMARGVTWAELGRGAAAAGAFAEARAAAGRIDRAQPADGFAVELADVERWHGHALVVLGDPGAAEPLEQALAAPPRSVRDRAGLHADLAGAHAAAGRTGAAEEHARHARVLAERIGAAALTARLPPTAQSASVTPARPAAPGGPSGSAVP